MGFSQWDAGEEKEFDPNEFEKLMAGQGPQPSDDDICPDCGMSHTESLDMLRQAVASEYEDIGTEYTRAIALKVLWDIVVEVLLRPTDKTRDAILESIVELARRNVESWANHELTRGGEEPEKETLVAFNEGVNEGFASAAKRFRAMFSKVLATDEFQKSTLDTIRRAVKG